MKSNLTAVPIVDKNGRATTVRKRLDKPLKAAQKPKLPSPTTVPEVPTKPSTRTPFLPAKQLSETAIDSFDEWYVSMLSKPVYNDLQRITYPRNLDPETKALVQRVLDRGVNAEAVVGLLDRRQNALNMSFAPELNRKDNSRAVLHIALRVAERMQEVAPEVTSSVSYHLAGNLKQLIAGYLYAKKTSDRRRLDSIDTEEDIDRIAAVSTFIVNAHKQATPEHYVSCNYTNPEGSSVRGLRLANPTMDAFLRENPDKAPRVIKYADERQMGSTTAHVKQMIQHLREAEEIGALGEGWL